MEHLDLSDNSISNIGALSNYSGLKTADPVPQCHHGDRCAGRPDELTALDLSENDITSVSALAKCTEMTELELASNRITSVAPLSGMRALTKLDLSKNALTDVSGLGLVPAAYRAAPLGQPARECRQCGLAREPDIP